MQGLFFRVFNLWRSYGFASCVVTAFLATFGIISDFFPEISNPIILATTANKILLFLFVLVGWTLAYLLVDISFKGICRLLVGQDIGSGKYDTEIKKMFVESLKILEKTPNADISEIEKKVVKDCYLVTAFSDFER